MRKTKFFSLALLAAAWLAGGTAFAQLDAEKVYTIVNNNDANMFMQDNGTGGVALGNKNDNSYWKFVPTANTDCYYIQNATTGKYIQGYTSSEEEVATGDTDVEYYVKADASGSYAGKYRMSYTANTPHDFSAGTLGLNWKTNGDVHTVQSFASVAEGNPRSAWTVTEAEMPTPDPGHVHDYSNNGVCTCDGDGKYQPAELVDGFYMLGNVGNVEWFSNYIEEVDFTASAKLTADIDFEGVENAHTPIGRNAEHKFDGTFDGQFHRIKGMVINTTAENQGFFGWIRGNAVIQNLTIDKTCSITGGNRSAAFAGTLQTPVDFKCKILNCVNEADVTSVGGVASGFIGAGQSAYAYFEIHNCVNFGKITGASTNKAAVFNGWGNNSGNGNAQVWNCYNTGEISPLDGTSTFFRGTYRSVQNCFDSFNTVYQNGVSAISAEEIANGRLCYLLNQGATNGISFKQTIGVDPYPLPVAEGDLVYEVADYYCDGTPKGSVAYSNTDGGTKDDHDFDAATGLCSFCSTPQVDWKTAEEDGFYYLGTPEEVEWFSAMVKAGYGAMNAKLTADIDFGGVENAHMPIGTSAKKYFGHFDGQGHRIKGMVLTTANNLENRPYDGQGFFGSVRGGGTATDGKYTNEVIIENLIIDASCSVNHDNNFAAGVVAHINSRNDENSNIIIRNCGNEANVTTTGKNAAGILGCVEATNVGLKLYNLWNKGNIVGNTGESAAICAWTGQRNIDGQVDVEGCWNIGEVTGVDGNGYNLIRRNSSIVPRNIVDLCLTNSGNQGKVTALNTEDPISSGELCYLLNEEDQDPIVYTQTLGTDEMPVYGTSSLQVFQAGTMNCAGVAVGGISYNNESGETIVLDHNFNEEMGMCDVCYTQFQEPALVDGMYELKNAGNVEWYGEYVGKAGGNHVGAKLMNDIDFYGIENLHSPIGPNEQNKFNSTFDGQGYRIKNMIIERPTDSNIGFFGWLRGNANNTTIKNLIIDESCSIHAYNRVGGVTGTYQNGGMTITIENVVNEATVTAEHQDAGGIFGGHQAGNPTIIIRDVLNTGTITAKNEHPYAGALCCYLGVDGGTSLIENFVNLGTVVGHEGGNIGRHNITNVTNLIDLSDTDPEGSTAAPNFGFESGLEKADIANGKLAYTVGWGQLIGTDEIPYPLNDTEVFYVGDAGYATMYDATTGYELNGDAQANVAVRSYSWLVLNGIENVPAGTPVVLTGTYYNRLASDLPAIDIANDLKGTESELEADGTMYVLAKPEGNDVGFYKASAGSVIPAGKAYYQSTSGVKAFFFGDDDATGISNVDVNVNLNEAIYNVAGQCLQKVQKGINIINGQKVLF